MDDLLEAARSGINGTAADFSNWGGVKEGGFKHMKINSSEKIIEPTEEGGFNENTVVQEVENRDIEPETKEAEPNEKDYENRPGAVQQAYLNPAELKSIAIKLMPSVDNMPNYTREAIRAVSENAINIAFEFLQVWNEKVSVE